MSNQDESPASGKEKIQEKSRDGFFRFVFSRFFLSNLLIAAVLTVFVVLIALQFLRSYTDHNSYITVPDLQGMSLEQASQMLERKHLQLNISDSLYEPRELPYTVLGQFPDDGSEVKKDRVVHLTVNKIRPQMVEVPVEEVIEKTLRSVQFNLQGKGFKIGELIYQPGVYDNQVLALRKGGDSRALEEGDKLPKGAVIDLVVTDGYGNTRVALPDLSGMTISEAKFLLAANNLVEGNSVFENGADSVKARVYRQNPEWEEAKYVKSGTMINIWLSDQPQQDAETSPNKPK